MVQAILEQMQTYNGEIAYHEVEGPRSRTRRKSVPNSPVQLADEPSSHRIQNTFKNISRKVKRRPSNKPTSSREKLKRSASMMPHLKASRSQDSLLNPETSLGVDLMSNDMQIRPLHSSILAQDHCFQITSSLGSKFYSCRSSSEREKWIESILSTVDPDKDDKRRQFRSLRLWIMEAKKLSANSKKSRYFCEIFLDDDIYAKTTSKQLIGSDKCYEEVFWSEQFKLYSFPDMNSLTIHLFREQDGKKKNKDVGNVHIPMNDLKSTIDSWFDVTTPKSSETPSIRIKASYQCIDILPLQQYAEFSEFLRTNAVGLCGILRTIQAKAKEEIATSLVAVLHSLGTVKDFLTEMVIQESEQEKDENNVLRANSMATKSIEAYMKLIGGKYLQDTLGDFILSIYESEESCEVDPSKLSQGPQQINENQETLKMLCEMIYGKIINSTNIFPSDLKEVFHRIRTHFTEVKNKSDLSDRLISACIFLRFLTPAIMSPSLFDLVQEYPNVKKARMLTLITKTIQALANFTRFGAKEQYMDFMNQFLEREWSNMRCFLSEISNDNKNGNVVKFDGYVDSGRELAILHKLLEDTLLESHQIEEYEQDNDCKVLFEILRRISAMRDNPNQEIEVNKNQLTHQHSSTSSSALDGSPHSNHNTQGFEDIFRDADLSQHAIEPLPPYNIACDKKTSMPSEVNRLVDAIQQGSPRHSNDSDVVIENNTNNQCIQKRAAPSRTISESNMNENASHVSLDDNNESKPVALSFFNPAYQYTSPKSHARHVTTSTSSSNSSRNEQNGSLSSTIDEGINSSSGSISATDNHNQGGVLCHTLPKAASRLSHTFTHMNKLWTESQSSTGLSKVTNVQSKFGSSSVSGSSSKVISHSTSSVSTDLSSCGNSEPLYDNLYFSSSGATSSEAQSGLQVDSDETPSDHFQRVLGKSKSASSIGPSSPIAVHPHSRSGSSAESPLSPIWESHTLPLPKSSSNCQAKQGGAPLSPVQPKLFMGTLSLERSTSLPSGDIINPTIQPSSSTSSLPRISHIQPLASPTSVAHPFRKHILTQYAKKPVKANSSASSSRTTTPVPDSSHNNTPIVSPTSSIRSNAFILQDAKNRSVTPSSSISSINSSSNESGKVLPVSLLPLTHLSRVDGEVNSPTSPTTEKRVQTDGKSPLEYENEIKVLKEKLDEVTLELHETQRKLEEEEQRANAAIAEMEGKARESQIQIHKQQTEKEQQIKNIISRLVCVEEKLKGEQEEMKAVVNAKQKIIDAQERRIESLDAANHRLMSALDQLKDRYHSRKVSAESNKNAPKISVNGNMKSSNC
ncbi:ras GTPase-activating protein nGAP-like isoform X3 [Anneissia japonica]|uniref:ras GTPase-activating protein nGAP-like isoform X3 n=1 Tax=Anneissia japonica TaxID=1529436 RepID=UPI0014254D3A|nr:ras GTPase-activating protein nGAP-like isoform X3 [Anneissia japonica]